MSFFSKAEEDANAPDRVHYVQIYEKADEMFEKERLDGVIIAANNKAHKPLTIMAAGNGCNIICEKPAALTVSDFDEMMEAVKKAGVSFTVHQQRRFDKDFATVKRCYDETICQWIRAVLEKKPDWAEAFIAVCLDMETASGFSANNREMP